MPQKESSLLMLESILALPFFAKSWLLKILQTHLASRHWQISRKIILQIRRFSYRASTQIHILALTVTDGSVPSSDRAEGLFHLNQLTLTSLTTSYGLTSQLSNCTSSAKFAHFNVFLSSVSRAQFIQLHINLKIYSMSKLYTRWSGNYV